MKSSWLANTRPNLCVYISEHAQITESVYNFGSKSAVKRLNSVIKYENDNLVHNKFSKLHLDTMRIVGYFDAAFASSPDLFSQLERRILLIGKSGAAAIVYPKSWKSRRVAKAVLPQKSFYSQIYSKIDFRIRKQFEQAMQNSLHMHLLTDRKCLFDIIGKGSRTNERHLMLKIEVVIQAYNEDQISIIGFVQSNYNLGDGLTNTKTQKSLHNLLRTGRH